MKLAIILLATATALATSVNAFCDPKCKQRTLAITADNSMELYLNHGFLLITGLRFVTLRRCQTEIQNLPNYNEWSRADLVSLPCTTRTIAVKGTNEGGYAGILASTDDDNILTDSSWKCTEKYYEGWQRAGYDDSDWPDAYRIAVHHTDPWFLVPGISAEAYWIWTAQNYEGDLVVYCRKNIPSSSCSPRTLSVTVDSYLHLYIDGVAKTNLPNANEWRESDSVELPCNAQVIAVDGIDDGIGNAGILASTSDGYLLTNGSWKCTNTFYSGWETVAYDDSAWPAAYEIALQQSDPWTLVFGIRTDAYWIWTEQYVNGDLFVYCRIRLPERIRCENTGTRTRQWF